MTRHANIWGVYEIESVPSQPQMAHCHAFFVYPAMRGKGNGHRLKASQNRTLHALGYSYAQCTVDAANAAQIAVLAKAGWRMTDDFCNAKTGKTTQVWGWEVRAV